jgi:hypothetical protein
MTIVLIFVPYAALAALMMVTSVVAALLAGAGLSAALIVLDVARGRSVKILAAGSAILCAGLAGYVARCNPGMSVSEVKVAIDAGIALLSLGSMLARSPFTLQYAREAVPAETAALPGFLRANYVITAAWAMAALLMMTGNVALIYCPELPLWIGLAVAFAARYGALYFTHWYPAYLRLKSDGKTTTGMLSAR